MLHFITVYTTHVSLSQQDVLTEGPLWIVLIMRTNAPKTRGMKSISSITIQQPHILQMATGNLAHLQ
jgi:hypothetical protein